MDRARIAAVLIVALPGCAGSAGDRARRDFDEVGRIDLGSVRASLDQGTCTWHDSDTLSARFRASAPEVTLTVISSAAVDRTVSVEVENVAPDTEVSGAAAEVRRGRKSLSFSVLAPAGRVVTVELRRPGLATASPWRFAWVGDVQGGLDRFARIRERIDADPAIELVIFAGDVTEQGTAGELADFVAAADELERPWYSVIGNHDTFESDSLFQRVVGRANVVFDYRGARIVLVDSAWATLAGRVRAFLERSLASGPALELVGMHVPPLDYDGLRDGGFASRLEGAQAMALLADGGADLLLAGHLHTLHVGSAAGVETVVSGNGGVGFDQKLDGSGLHYLAVDVDPGREAVTVTPVEVP